MPRIFYRANFCAECGNPLKPRPGWRPRYFCRDCAAGLSRRRYFTPLSAILILLLAWFALNDRPASVSTSHSSDPANPVQSPPIVSAHHASAEQVAPPPATPRQTAVRERVQCGARTRRGTPCRHLTRPGERCAQHRGMPSMLESKSGSNRGHRPDPGTEED
jgi:hypothetical protein